MDKIRIVGGPPLEGTVRISGAKNASLPALCAALLTDEAVNKLIASAVSEADEEE